MAEPKPIGAIIDGLGVTASLDDGQLVEAVVVGLKVIDPDGKARFRAAWSDGLDFITLRGMVEILRDGEVIEPSAFHTDE